jgi:putative Mn2+ efflux pump MntP
MVLPQRAWKEKIMHFGEILMIGLGLSMDAAAVSMSYAMVRHTRRAALLEMAVLFGVFQGVMPLLGYGIGGIAAELIRAFGGAAILVILGIVGAKMIYSGVAVADDCKLPASLGHHLLLGQAVATSIDAFAVGVGFRAMEFPVFFAAVSIACTTLVCSLAAIKIGRRFGCAFGRGAEVLGGLILIAIGLKAAFFPL